MAVFLMLILLIFLQMSTGTSSPQSLKKILSLSEEGNERHRRQPEDTVSNASSQLSSPPTSPQSSPKKGKPIILPPSHTTLQALSLCHNVPQMPPGGCQHALHHVSDNNSSSKIRLTLFPPYYKPTSVPFFVTLETVLQVKDSGTCL